MPEAAVCIYAAYTSSSREKADERTIYVAQRVLITWPDNTCNTNAYTYTLVYIDLPDREEGCSARSRLFRVINRATLAVVCI